MKHCRCRLRLKSGVLQKNNDSGTMILAISYKRPIRKAPANVSDGHIG